MNKCVEVWGLKQYSHRNRILSFCSIATRCHKPKVEIKLYSFSQESSLPAASTMTFCSCLATCGTHHAIFNLCSQLIHGLPHGYTHKNPWWNPRSPAELPATHFNQSSAGVTLQHPPPRLHWPWKVPKWEGMLVSSQEGKLKIIQNQPFDQLETCVLIKSLKVGKVEAGLMPSEEYKTKSWQWKIHQEIYNHIIF